MTANLKQRVRLLTRGGILVHNGRVIYSPPFAGLNLRGFSRISHWVPCVFKQRATPVGTDLAERESEGSRDHVSGYKRDWT